MEAKNVMIMKLLATILFFFLFLTGAFSQTRNVLVNTSSVVVQPTNFWSADSSNARVGLGLGNSATNPSSAFQSSSSVLSNLASSNAINITNLRATNIIGSIAVVNGGTGGTNAATARQNLGSTTVGDAVFIATNALSARSAIGATTVGGNILTLTNPSSITFLRVNSDNSVSALSSSDFRAAIGLGSASTNPFSAFQPSSASLSNLANNNGGNLTNITISNVVGLLATNGNGAGLTNLTATNISGTVAISSGGTGATNAATARTNLGLGSTNSVSFGALTVANETYVGYAEIGWDTVKIQFEERYFDAGSGFGWTFNQAPIFADVSGTRTNLGLSLAALTNTNITNFRTAIGLGSTNTVTFGNVSATSILHEGGATIAVDLADGILRNVSQNVLEFGDSAAIYAYLPIAFISNSFAATTRTNLGLGSSWLTNTNVTNFRSAIGLGWSTLTNTNAANFQSALYGSNTNPVLVDSSGLVISPTNFWQVAPIQTLVQTFVPTVSSNSYGTNARNLYVYSMAASISGVTNTVVLPTNSATFDGDAATVTHKGTTSSVTAVRQAGSATNFTTISNEDESVKFIREGGQWTFYHNISYVEPIRFTDGNIEANRATSRTNLGLGFSALTNTNTTNFQVAIFNTNTAPTNSGNMTFGSAVAWMEINIHTNGTTNSYRIPLFSKP